MEVKWICSECSSINICEESDHMTCFVCGSPCTRTSVAGTAGTSIERRDTVRSLTDRIKAFFASMVKEPDRRRPVDWTISRGPSDSKEAYVKATPVYAERTEAPPALPVEETRSRLPVGGRSTRPEPVTTAADSTPWPEERGVFNMEKLRASGFTKVERTEMGGVRAYRLTDRTGAQRVLPPKTMRALGFIQDR